MFKETIASAVVVTVEEIVKPLHTETSLKDEVAHLKLKLANVEAKTNDNEQYSRRNNFLIFGLAELKSVTRIATTKYSSYVRII